MVYLYNKKKLSLFCTEFLARCDVLLLSAAAATAPGTGFAAEQHVTRHTETHAHHVLFSGLRIRIGSGFNQVSGSGFGIQIRIRIQEGFLKVKVLKCWMASFES
jgi:hypothetical protein